VSGQTKNITSYILSFYTPGRPCVLTHTHTHTHHRHYYNIITLNNISGARTRIKRGGGRRTQYSDFCVFRWLRLKKTKPHSNLSLAVVVGDVYGFRRRRCAGTFDVRTYLPTYLPIGTRIYDCGITDAT